MTDIPLLQSLGFVLVAAAFFVLVARGARVPSIVAYILAGLTLGPVTGLIAVTEAIELMAEFGIALLLFVVGLELSLDKIRDVGRVALFAGLGQVFFTAAGGFVIAFLLGFTVLESVFLATALTFSSTVVVVKLLDEKKELNALYGRIAVGIFLVQDLIVIVVLTFLAGLARQEGASLPATMAGLGIAFAGMALLLAAALLSARYVLPRVFGWVAAESEALFIWGLCWCFLFVMGAEALQLSLEIGAFLAGISLAQLPYHHELRRRVHPLMSFFIAVFFVVLGIQMDLAGAAAHWDSAIALSLFVLIGNPLIFMWIISRMGYGERTSFLTSVTVAQISEFSFIFAAMGLGTGLIDETILSLIAVVGLVTIGISSYMILYNHQLYDLARRLRLLRPFGAAPEPEPVRAGGRSGHVIVVGMNSLGRQIARALCERGESVLGIDRDPNKLESLPCETMLGDVEYTSVLEEAEIEQAKLVVSALQIEETNNMLAYHARGLGVPVSIHAFDRSVVPGLQEIGADHLILSKNAGIRRLAEELRREGVLE